MPLLIDTDRSGSDAELRGGNCLTIGFVNNMPETAWDATERQFLGLLRAAALRTIVRCRLFSLSDGPHGEAPAENSRRYRDLSELWDMRLDGLIVTGTEPRAAHLPDEPYWPALSRLVDWARDNTVSTVWSCLAAHAAVLHADGIERRPLDDKLSGVFDCDVSADSPLLKNTPARLRVPHSRYNDLPEAALVAAGYRILGGSPLVGVDAFARMERDRSLFVFFQGHPEYDTDTLAREYRRDVGRFLRGERDNFPATPRGYFNDRATAAAEDFRVRALRGRHAGLIGEFPMSALETGLENSWRHSATGIYENWLSYLKDRKAERRTATLATMPVRRSRRNVPRNGQLQPAAGAPGRRAAGE